MSASAVRAASHRKSIVVNAARPLLLWPGVAMEA